MIRNGYRVDIENRLACSMCEPECGLKTTRETIRTNERISQRSASKVIVFGGHWSLPHPHQLYLVPFGWFGHCTFLHMLDVDNDVYWMKSLLSCLLSCWWMCYIARMPQTEDGRRRLMMNCCLAESGYRNQRSRKPPL